MRTVTQAGATVSGNQVGRELWQTWKLGSLCPASKENNGNNKHHMNGLMRMKFLAFSNDTPSAILAHSNHVTLTRSCRYIDFQYWKWSCLASQKCLSWVTYHSTSLTSQPYFFISGGRSERERKIWLDTLASFVGHNGNAHNVCRLCTWYAIKTFIWLGVIVHVLCSKCPCTLANGHNREKWRKNMAACETTIDPAIYQLSLSDDFSLVENWVHSSWLHS